MRIMAAGVRHVDGLPVQISRSERRGVGQARVLLDRKRVHVGPREHRLAFAVPQDADNARTANPFEDFVTEFLEFRRRERGRFGLLKTQLGMRVELLVNTFLPS